MQWQRDTIWIYHNESTDGDDIASVSPSKQLSLQTSETGTYTNLIGTKTVTFQHSNYPVLSTLVPSRPVTADVSIQVDNSSQPQPFEC